MFRQVRLCTAVTCFKCFIAHTVVCCRVNGVTLTVNQTNCCLNLIFFSNIYIPIECNLQRPLARYNAIRSHLRAWCILVSMENSKDKLQVKFIYRVLYRTVKISCKWSSYTGCFIEPHEECHPLISCEIKYEIISKAYRAISQSATVYRRSTKTRTVLALLSCTGTCTSTVLTDGLYVFPQFLWKVPAYALHNTSVWLTDSVIDPRLVAVVTVLLP